MNATNYCRELGISISVRGVHIPVYELWGEPTLSPHVPNDRLVHVDCPACAASRASSPTLTTASQDCPGCAECDPPMALQDTVGEIDEDLGGLEEEVGTQADEIAALRGGLKALADCMKDLCDAIRPMAIEHDKRAREQMRN